MGEPEQLPATVIRQGGGRREIDGILASELDGTAVVEVHEHKHHYDPMAQAQLCSAAYLVQHDMIRRGGRFHGRSVVVVAALVLHGPAAARVPPSVDEASKVPDGFKGRRIKAGPVVLVLLWKIPLEELYADPEGMALLVAMDLANRDDVTDELILYLLDIADRLLRMGELLLSDEILVNIGRELNDQERLDRLTLELWGKEKTEEIMENWLDRKYRQHAEKIFAAGKVESLMGIARKRFGDVPGTLEERLQAASLEDLDSWQDRLLEARSIDEAMKGNGSWGNGVSV